MRNLNNNILEKLTHNKYKVITLVQSQWSTGELNLTNFATNILYNGKEYIGLGHLLGIDNIEESRDLNITENSLLISGLPNNIKSLLLEESIHYNPVQISFALLDNHNKIIDQPFLIQEGFINSLQAIDDYNNQTTTIQVYFSSQFERFEDSNGYRSNPNEQRQHFLNDAIFDSVPKLTEAIIRW